MKFQDNARPIFQQIADRICDEVSTGVLGPEERIPSVRDYAAKLQVNANTVMRSFEYLASQEIIYNKRGIGYFISPDAVESIRRMRESTFFDEDLPYFFSRLRSNGVDPAKLTELYTDYLKKS